MENVPALYANIMPFCIKDKNVSVFGIHQGPRTNPLQTQR